MSVPERDARSSLISGCGVRGAGRRGRRAGCDVTRAHSALTLATGPSRRRQKRSSGPARRPIPHGLLWGRKGRLCLGCFASHYVFMYCITWRLPSPAVCVSAVTPCRSPNQVTAGYANAMWRVCTEPLAQAVARRVTNAPRSRGR